MCRGGGVKVMARSVHSPRLNNNNNNNNNSNASSIIPMHGSTISKSGGPIPHVDDDECARNGLLFSYHKGHRRHRYRLQFIVTACFVMLSAFFALDLFVFHTSAFFRWPALISISAISLETNRTVSASTSIISTSTSTSSHLSATAPLPLSLSTDHQLPPLAHPPHPPPPPLPPSSEVAVIKEGGGSHHLSSPSQSTHQKTPAVSSFYPPADYPHRCYLQTIFNESQPLDSYPFNSRSFCLASTTCFRPSSPSQPSTLYHAAPLDQTTCLRTAADFQPLDDKPSNCSYIQSLVHLAHGRYISADEPVYPEVKPMSELSRDELSSARWLEGFVFYVPAYPHLKNIYHFSFIVGAISHILSASTTLIREWRHGNVDLPNPLPVVVVFRNAQLSAHGLWQKSIMDFIVNHRFKMAGINVQYTSMDERNFMDEPEPLTPQHLTCSKSSILLGARSDVNIWPFPASVEVFKDGLSVPVEAISFRHAVYRAVGIQNMFPSLPQGALTPPPEMALFDLPPKVIGYARRNKYPDHTAEFPGQVGTKRRFSDADDIWFASMLQDVASAHKFSYSVLQPTVTTDMNEQVRMFSKVGLLAGIHGANLMNSIFMFPFGGLIEVFAKQPLQCYIAGANSGLNYAFHTPVQEATEEESGCLPVHPCWHVTHMRRVKIGTDMDRSALRKIVEDGVARIEILHKTFGALGGIPVVYNKTSTSFQIDWHRRPS